MKRKSREKSCFFRRLGLDLVVRDDRGNVIDPLKTSTIGLYRMVNLFAFLFVFKILEIRILIMAEIVQLVHAGRAGWLHAGRAGWLHPNSDGS